MSKIIRKLPQKKQPKRQNAISQLRRELPSSFANQLRIPAAWYPGQPNPLTAAASVIATSVGLDPTNQITGWVARFESTFDEYRVVEAKVEFSLTSPFVGGLYNAGLLNVWFDEKVAAAPTANEAKERTQSVQLPFSTFSGVTQKTIHWRAVDLLDLEFAPINTAVSPAYVKAYTDATWGALGSATVNIGLYRIFFKIEFRGLKST